MALAASAQSFYNLDFELARVTPPGPAQVPIGLGLPGWTGYCGGDVQTTVNYNQEYLDTVGISILDTNDSQQQLAGLLHGRYCALIQSGLGWGPSRPVDAALAQTGTIPAGARRIVFNAGWILSGAELVVTFNGTPIPIAALSPQATYMVFGGDVTPFAGQTGELRFTRPVLWRSFPPNPIVYPSYGPILLDDIRFSSSPLEAAPVILTFPGSRAVDAGSSLELAVIAIGYPTLGYQWWLNATNLIVGATNSVLSLTNVQFSQAGAYTVVISNMFGSVISPPANLTVRDPFLTGQPSARSVNAGQAASFMVAAGGTQPLSYQWLKDGVLLSDGGKVSGAQTTRLTLSNVFGADAGGYRVIISNGYSSVTSMVATLTVRDPIIASQPESQLVNAGQTVSFNVVAEGTAPLAYQWFNAGVALNDGGNVSGAQTSVLTLSGVLSGDADAYGVVISNAYGSTTSRVAFVDMTVPRYSVLRAFARVGGNPNPNADLVLSGGTLYGTAETSVFRINTDGTGFATIAPRMLEGANGGIVSSGNTLYGTTYSGENAPTPDYGRVFKVNTDGTAFAVLKSFNGGDDGGLVWAAPVLSGPTLYGTANTDGSSGYGTLFRVNTDGTGFAVLRSFSYDAGHPQGGMAISSGTLYGTLTYDNVNGIAGKVFQINTDGSNFAILKNFIGTDGRYPLSGLVISGATLYGTTYYGGSGSPGIGAGTVFKINTDGIGFTVLKRFGGGTDGANPAGDLVVSGGMLYGTTSSGGISNYGTLFQLSLDGGQYTVLKRFRGNDGANPSAGLVCSGTALYGTTLRGGSSNQGVVFAFSLPFAGILTPPLSQTAEVGSTVVFDVRATTNSATCQWLFNGSNVFIGDPTAFCLRITNVQPSHVGAYTAVLANSFGTVTSAPAMLSVIPPVPRRIVPALSLSGQPGSTLNLDNAALLAPSPNWASFDNVALTNTSQWYFDLSDPLPLQRFYRAWQPGPSNVAPFLDLHMVPALSLTGAVGSSWRIDCINRFGPTDAWTNLATVTLTNTSQLYFDTSSIGQPPRLWRIVPVP